MITRTKRIPLEAYAFEELVVSGDTIEEVNTLMDNAIGSINFSNWIGYEEAKRAAEEVLSLRKKLDLFELLFSRIKWNEIVSQLIEEVKNSDEYKKITNNK